MTFNVYVFLFFYVLIYLHVGNRPYFEFLGHARVSKPETPNPSGKFSL